LAYAPADAKPFFTKVVQGRFELIPQASDDLGCRMRSFFTERFQTGADRIVLVGTDSPTLPLTFVEQAFQELKQADVVLGPATDGGYYLVGCARHTRKGSDVVPPIFEEIPWSTSQVLRETVTRLKSAKLSAALLPPWYDVDTLDDWRMLRGHVAAQRYAGLDPGVPHTERLLEDPYP
jgi:rSAM/selenodomain-associated transferase 1